MQTEVDVAVVGAGVVGLAVAARLSRHLSVAVLERHAGYGRENSSHNSGVIHAGLYYPPGWLKTALCVEGNGQLYAWCEERGVRVRRCGKLVIAAGEDELPELDRLAEAARANGVRDVRPLEPAEIHALEPSVRAVAGLWSGSSGVVDQMGLMRSLLAEAQSNGGHVAFKHEVLAAARHDGGFLLGGRGPDRGSFSLAAARLVNAAGLAADRIGALVGYDPDGGPSNPPFRQYANRGCYYDIAAPAAAGLRHLVYPVPHADRVGLGVHLTIDIDGGAHVGPDTEWLAEGEPLDFRSRDERRDQFLASACRYLPHLRAEDLAPGQTGYRPKLQRPDGPAQDFLIWHDRGYVHLGGIESPGMTASLAIARRVSEQLATG